MDIRPWRQAALREIMGVKGGRGIGEDGRGNLQAVFSSEVEREGGDERGGG